MEHDFCTLPWGKEGDGRSLDLIAINLYNGRDQGGVGLRKLKEFLTAFIAK